MSLYYVDLKYKTMLYQTNSSSLKDTTPTRQTREMEDEQARRMAKKQTQDILQHILQEIEVEAKNKAFSEEFKVE